VSNCLLNRGVLHYKADAPTRRPSSEPWHPDLVTPAKDGANSLSRVALSEDGANPAVPAGNTVAIALDFHAVPVNGGRSFEPFVTLMAVRM